MRRHQLAEMHDHPRCPGFLRDLMTDALESLWAHTCAYDAIVPRLSAAMERAGSHQVLDLCSGGGGPWMNLAEKLECARGSPVKVRLTDRCPNRDAFERSRVLSQRLDFWLASVEAAHVPSELSGFRTMFSTFHHFAPAEARRVLSNAVESGCGIAIFEAARRSPKTVLTLFAVPLLIMALAPAVWPFRWARLFWTLVVPLVPFLVWYDGLVSCLKTYSHEELKAMTREIDAAGYDWQVGEERSGWLPITYLIGYPATEARIPVPSLGRARSNDSEFTEAARSVDADRQPASLPQSALQQ